MTIINSRSNYTPSCPVEYANFVQILNHPQRGRQYLVTAIESQNEQIFLAALHNLMDAILRDLESGDRACI